MIVLDTTVLVYAVGSDHNLREPCRRLVEVVSEGRLEATTTVEAIQEFVHVRARHRGRRDAVDLGRAYARLLAPLLRPTAEDLDGGLSLFARHQALGPFDAVLAAAATSAGAEALVSADAAFSRVPGVKHIHPASAALGDLLGE
ncbi:MAG: type II toxin-antitoxin system VapC family toxin [Acidobacteria bacterium]|nr:type II toxin-antitoxin system VapC family toxin [Acidobacteriota bacterium]